MATPVFNVGDRIYGKVKPVDPIASLGVIKSVQEGPDGRRYKVAYEGYGEKDGHFVEPYNAAYQIFDANIVEGVRRKRAEQFKHSLEVGWDYFGDTERPRISNEESFALGDEVSCLWASNNSVYKGNIIELEESDGDWRYKVRFPKFGSRWDQWVEAQEVPFLLSRTKKKLEEIAKKNKALAKSKPITTGVLVGQNGQGNDEMGDMAEKENASRKRKRRTGQFKDEVEEGNNNNEDGRGEIDEVAPRKIRRRTKDLRENMTDGRGGCRSSSLVGEAVYRQRGRRAEEFERAEEETEDGEGEGGNFDMVDPVELNQLGGDREDRGDGDHSEEVIIDATPTEYTPEQMETIRSRAVDDIPPLFDRSTASTEEIAKEDKVRDCLMWSRPEDFSDRRLQKLEDSWKKKSLSEEFILRAKPLHRMFRSSSWLELLNSTRSTNSQSSEFPFGRKPDHDREQKEFSKEEIERFITEMAHPETSKNFYNMKKRSLKERTTSELVHYRYHMHSGIITEESQLYRKFKGQQRRMDAIERNLMDTIESRLRPDDWKESKMRITAPLRANVEDSEDDGLYSDEDEDGNMANQEKDVTSLRENNSTMDASIFARHENIDSAPASSSSRDVGELLVKREANEHRSDEGENVEGGEEVGSGGGTEPIDQSKPLRERSGLRKRTTLASHLQSIGFFDDQEDSPHIPSPLFDIRNGSGSFAIPHPPILKHATRKEQKALETKRRERNRKGKLLSMKSIKVEDRECSPMDTRDDSRENANANQINVKIEDPFDDFAVPSIPSRLPRSSSIPSSSSSSLVSSASSTLSNSQTESSIGPRDPIIVGIKSESYQMEKLSRENRILVERAENAERENDELKQMISAMQRTMELGVRLVARMSDHPARVDDVKTTMKNLLERWDCQTGEEEN